MSANHAARRPAMRHLRRLYGPAVAGGIAGAMLLSGCGGSSSSHHSPVPSARTSTSTPPAEPSPAPAAPPPSPTTVTGSGVRAVTTISTCLAQHEVATSAPPVPPGMSAPADPKVLLAMPWDAVQISVYAKPRASTSAVTLANAGAVMTRGNVSVGLDQLPVPPPSVMRTIEACALG